MTDVEVLLATCNSAAYLEPLLDSLLAQTIQDFRLIVSDDCSVDETLAILERRLPEFHHARLIRRAQASGSAKANFATLMQVSTAAHVFLCDADDIWYPGKIETFLVRAREKETVFGAATPLFLFSDAAIVDADGRLRHDSYWAFKKITPARCLTLERLLVCPPMLGCASLMNRALVEIARDVPVDRVTGHDWWAILVAACFGHVDYIADRTIAYRVHGRNASQPKQVGLLALGRLARRLPDAVHEVRRRLAIRHRQAEPLLEMFGPRLALPQRARIEAFLSVQGRSFLGRRLMLFGRGFTYPDPVRNLALFLFC